jgi:plasmid stability protein
MQPNKDLKRLIRARAAKTGESYSTARRHVLRAGTEGEHAMQFDTSVGDDGRHLVVAMDPPADDIHVLVRNMDFQLDATGRPVWEYPAHASGWDTAARNRRRCPPACPRGRGRAPNRR